MEISAQNPPQVVNDPVKSQKIWVRIGFIVLVLLVLVISAEAIYVFWGRTKSVESQNGVEDRQFSESIKATPIVSLSTGGGSNNNFFNSDRANLEIQKLQSFFNSNRAGLIKNAQISYEISGTVKSFGQGDGTDYAYFVELTDNIGNLIKIKLTDEESRQNVDSVNGNIVVNVTPRDFVIGDSVTAIISSNLLDNISANNVRFTLKR